MGAEAIQYLLKELDLPKLEKALQKEIEEGSGQRKVRCIRRLEEVEAFLHSGNKPEWMILSVLPGHSPRSASDGPARWRPFRHLRPE